MAEQMKALKDWAQPIIVLATCISMFVTVQNEVKNIAQTVQELKQDSKASRNDVEVLKTKVAINEMRIGRLEEKVK